jgi:hypothetical protein
MVIGQEQVRDAWVGDDNAMPHAWRSRAVNILLADRPSSQDAWHTCLPGSHTQSGLIVKIA